MTLASLLCQAAFAQENLVRSGNYEIRFCGKGPRSKAAQLQTLLPLFRDDLQLVLADAKRGNASKAYRAYFKSQSNAAYVESIFQAMADGAVVQIPPRRGSPSKQPHRIPPSVICLDPKIPNIDTLSKVCVQAAASILPNSHIVLLCPSFWAGMKRGPLRWDCPRVKGNRFAPDDYRVAYNQFGLFVHEFAHAYTRNWDTRETYRPTAAVKLSAALSLRNPNNFALYAASELSFFLRYHYSSRPPERAPTGAEMEVDRSIVGVVAGCPRYVNPALIPDEERELLAIPAENATEAAALSSSSSAAEASRSIDPSPDP
ncbi:MAG: hypothetical protein LQ346_001900 [Caloplaca aetnensis]|nr:MAG: hypothetical protein LQ346_001900 [Caloplaca aetnensis]